jgi:hypothetical protein
MALWQLCVSKNASFYFVKEKMTFVSNFLVACAVLLPVIHAHGSLKAVEVGGQQYPAWQINKDQFEKVAPVRYSRKVANEGPVKDFTSKGITYTNHPLWAIAAKRTFADN